MMVLMWILAAFRKLAPARDVAGRAVLIFQSLWLRSVVLLSPRRRSYILLLSAGSVALGRF